MYRFSGRYHKGAMREDRRRKQREAYDRRISCYSYSTKHDFEVVDEGGELAIRCKNAECHQVWNIRVDSKAPKSHCPWQPHTKESVKAEATRKGIEVVAKVSKQEKQDRHISSTARTRHARGSVPASVSL